MLEERAELFARWVTHNWPDKQLLKMAFKLEMEAVLRDEH